RFASREKQGDCHGPQQNCITHLYHLITSLCQSLHHEWRQLPFSRFCKFLLPPVQLWTSCYSLTQIRKSSCAAQLKPMIPDRYRNGKLLKLHVLQSCGQWPHGLSRAHSAVAGGA